MSQRSSQPNQQPAGHRPRNAVILAAGVGMRMVPINFQTPKALLEINGEALIERLITQLHEVGVRDITVVTGFMHQSLSYLAERFGVTLLHNADFAVKNNLHSLALAADKLDSTYIVPSDIWCRRNPFSRCESGPWYMVSNAVSNESCVRAEQGGTLHLVDPQRGGNAMIGIAFVAGEAARTLRDRLRQMDADAAQHDAFWESALYGKRTLSLPAKMADLEEVTEISTYEQLRSLDARSNQLQSDALNVIASVFSVKPEDITDITVLKKGMTNRSFLFTCNGKRYIMRVPGEGTDRLINRAQEACVYRAVADRHLSDDVVYIDPSNGYKITAFLPDARTCDAMRTADVRACMQALRRFHSMQLRVEHRFDLFEQIEYYHSLWDGAESVYPDHRQTTQQIFSLKPFLQRHAHPEVLTHIDAVPDNFLFTDNGAQIRLIDWEYAGMQDPHVDIAMFCIYAMYNKRRVDQTIDLYFPEGCDEAVRTKIYGYIAVCGLLWSNWCEYKRLLGVEFGDYATRQYRFAKQYYRYVQKRLQNDCKG